MAKRFTDSEKWKKKWFRSLSNDQKVFWFFILDNCNHAGIWDVDFDFASIFCGPVNEIEIYEKFKKQYQELDGGKKWFILDFINFQYGELNPNNNLHRSVISILEKLGAKEPLKSPSSGPMVKDKDKDKVKEKDIYRGFAIPTIEEVKVYCLERKNIINPQSFIDFYDSKGWMIGKNKMKDWKAAVRNWETRNKSSDTVNISKRLEVKPVEYEKPSEEDQKKLAEMMAETRKKLKITIG